MIAAYPSAWMVGNLLLMGLLSHFLTRGPVPLLAALPLIILYADKGNFPGLIMCLLCGVLIRFFAMFGADPDDVRDGL